jgi:hypothetical protein
MRSNFALIGEERTVVIKNLAFALIVTAVAPLCAAQTVLRSEPLVLAPYQIAFVEKTCCPAGKVLKVTGAIRGLDRKRVCVVLSAERASFATANASGSTADSAR